MTSTAERTEATTFDSTNPAPGTSAGVSTAAPAKPRRARDLRIDALRGFALVTILISHAPGNPLAAMTIGRFGLSDAAEIFVFLAGIGAAMAFGPRLLAAGGSILPGIAAVVQRMALLWRAHLTVFALVVALCLWANLLGIGGGTDYIRELNLGFVMNHPGHALMGLMSLSYVPNYFDILPMYIVLMAMVPAFLYLGRLSPALALSASVALYGGAQLLDWHLPAEVVSGRQWFFNPFAWQLLFFTGMALRLGWLRVPQMSDRMLAAAFGMLGLGFVLGFAPLREALEPVKHTYGLLLPLIDKTDFGLLRWVYFLSLAFVTLALLQRAPQLAETRAARLLAACGAQAMPCFVAVMVLSRAMGMGFDALGDGIAATLAVNLAAVAILLGLAQLWTWMAGKPWRQPVAAVAAAPAAAGPGLFQPARLAPLELAPVRR